MRMILLTIGILLLLTSNSKAGNEVCMFGQSDIFIADSISTYTCFKPNQIAKKKVIWHGRNGNLIYVILWNGKSFYKPGFTITQFNSCVAGKIPCDRTWNVKPRDLTRGDISIFKKKKNLYKRADRNLMACAGGSSLHCN